ncbi:hypothetical protein G6F61_015202 [Rhizopus arrhizus]|nr:hypothetical protein G6F61_015202 [Rhizopus arrhizus]
MTLPGLRNQTSTSAAQPITRSQRALKNRIRTLMASRLRWPRWPSPPGARSPAAAGESGRRKGRPEVAAARRPVLARSRQPLR